MMRKGASLIEEIQKKFVLKDYLKFNLIILSFPAKINTS